MPWAHAPNGDAVAQPSAWDKVADIAPSITRPRAWPVAPSYSGVTADAKWAGLTREWRQLCAPKEGAREVLLTRLRARPLQEAQPPICGPTQRVRACGCCEPQRSAYCAIGRLASRVSARPRLEPPRRAYRDAHHHGVGWAQEVPTAQLAVLAEAIADYDSSMAPAPSAPPQRREYVENWRVQRLTR